MLIAHSAPADGAHAAHVDDRAQHARDPRLDSMEDSRGLRGETVEKPFPDPTNADASSDGPPFRVGDFEVQPRLHRLVDRDKTVQLEPKIMGVMVALARDPGAVVSRRALQEAVWGTPHASEDLPRRAISRLRKALGDDPAAPRYIETIPRAGYRLLVPVQRLLPAEPTQAQHAPQAQQAQQAAQSPRHADRSSRSRSSRPRMRTLGARTIRLRRVGSWSIGLVLLAALLSAGILRSGLRSAGPSHAARSLTVTPLTSLPGPELAPAISPDGSRVAFLRAPSTEIDAPLTLEVQLLGTTSSITLNETAADFGHPIESPAWSPDNTRIAYRRWRAGHGWALYEISALGGAERLIRELGRGATSGLSWSPDGHTLVFGHSTASGRPMALHSLDLRDGSLHALTTPAGTAIGDGLPRHAPDGRSIAFVRSIAIDASAIHRISTGGTGETTIVAGPHKIADFDWSADGHALIVAQFQAGHHRLVRYDVATGTGQLFDAAGEGARWLDVARTGNQLVYGRARFDLSVREVDLVTGATQSLPALSSTFFDEGLALSPSGTRLALTSTRSGSYELWTFGFAGESPRRLSDFGNARVGRPTWVEGDATLVFAANPGGTFDLFAVARDGGAPTPLTKHPGEDRAPHASLDGEQVYFASDRSGSWQVWSMAVTGGPAQQITHEGGFHARPSPDGRWLYFTRFEEDGLWRLPLTGPRNQAERVLENTPRRWSGGNWLVRDEGIWVVTQDAQGQSFVSLFDPASRQRMRQVPLPTIPVPHSLTASPRANHVLFATIDRVESDLVHVSGIDSIRDKAR